MQDLNLIKSTGDAGSAVFWFSISPSGVLDGLSLHTLCPAAVTRWGAAVQVLYQTPTIAACHHSAA